MTQPPEPTPDELRDRLLERNLREITGRETPPDLRATILQRAASPPLAPPIIAPESVAAAERQPAEHGRAKAKWSALAVAAGLLVAAGLIPLTVNRDGSDVAPQQQASVEGKQFPLQVSNGRPDAQSNGTPTQNEKEKVDIVHENFDANGGLHYSENVDVDGYGIGFGARSSSELSSSQLAASTGTPVSNTARGGASSTEFAAMGMGGYGGMMGGYGGSTNQLQSGRGAGLKRDTWGFYGSDGAAWYSEHDIQQQFTGNRQGIVDAETERADVSRQLAELEVKMRVAAMSAKSPGAHVQEIAASLDGDPTIANFQQEIYELDQQIRQRSSASKGPNAPEIKQLRSMKNQAAQQMALYRRQAEASIRARLSNRPDDELQRTQFAYAEKKKALEERLAELEEGIGPGHGGDRYEPIVENPFIRTSDENISTFSIDVDTASYANVRQFLLGSHQLPPPDAVRIEELVNYFDYDYSPPTDETPFAANVEVASCPWNSEHRLVRVGIKGRELDGAARPQSNLVFLIDVSGSMNEPEKLPLLVEGMKLLTRELGENDRVAIVVYASSEGLALPSTPGTDQAAILAALEQLRAGGSTAGGAGIRLAYEIAEQHFITGGVNRVILCTDGDFNVGVTSPGALGRMAEQKARETGVFLTVLGFGRGNLNDAMMERISGKGNGNYHYVDGPTEARKVLVAEMTGTLVTIAKDVKIQIDFNPAQVAGYRLIGYENRMLQTQDFNDDAKDAGEIGAGHTVTALYELVPAGAPVATAGVDESKYVRPSNLTAHAADSGELMTLKIRYKQPDGDVSTKLEFPISDSGEAFAAASSDFQFAASVAAMGMLLRDSAYSGDATLSGVLEIATSAAQSRDPHGYRAEFLKMVSAAIELGASD